MRENHTDEVAYALHPCPRCLIREMADQAETYRSLRECIDNLDIDIKAPAPLYEERLGVCRECGLLFQGMCRGCGCYVELRAAVAGNVCPYDKW